MNLIEKSWKRVIKTAGGLTLLALLALAGIGIWSGSERMAAGLREVIGELVEMIRTGRSDLGDVVMPNEAEVSVEESAFEVHFLDVGQGDAALVLCDGEAMLIDGGGRASSSFLYSYLQSNEIEYLDYVVATHAHEDHVGGLAGALNYADVGTVLCSATEYDSDTFRSFVKYMEKQGKQIEIPETGDSFPLGSAEVTVVSADTDAPEINDRSLVLRVVYGETSFLFTGDAERSAEQAILDSGIEVESTVLKVGHHGSDTSTTYPFLRAVYPEYAVISVGAGNDYGHPTDDVLSRLRDADAEVFRTDLHGTIICRSDGSVLTFEGERVQNMKPEVTPASNEANPDSLGEEAVLDETEYILNTNTKKFHVPSCAGAMQISEKNKRHFTGSRDAAVRMGYVPCRGCLDELQ